MRRLTLACVVAHFLCGVQMMCTVPSSIVRAIAGSLLGSTGSPIIQMVVDHHRGLVYTLTENGTIEGFDLGVSGREFRLFGRCSISCVPVVLVCIAWHRPCRF